MTLRSIDIGKLRKLMPPVEPASLVGAMPQLEWLAIDKLLVDAAYQRDILDRGMRKIIRIATHFKWSRFSPVVVGRAVSGHRPIIDGQHRTAAAMLRDIVRVPCLVLDIDQAEQAAAFAAINADVTAVTPLQLHAARVAAGDKGAKALDAACRAADVTILRYPVPATKMAAGQTLAAGRRALMLTRYGPKTLAAALSCVTKTRKGNPGLLRSPIILALCTVLDLEPAWMAKPEKLIRAMQFFDFAAEWTIAGQRSYAERKSMASVLIERITNHLERKLGVPGE